MRPDDHAAHAPGRAALVMGGSGETLSYRALAEGSRALAARMRAAGLRSGDHVAMLLENRAEMLIAAWAAHRLGLHYTPINWHLQSDEIGYILDDCGARLLFASPALAARLAPGAGAALELRIAVGACAAGAALPSGYTDLDDFIGDAVATADTVSYETEGGPMFYSSGTTGRPKGIKRALSGTPFGQPPSWEAVIYDTFDIDPHTVYLCPAPLYHAAPLSWSMAVQRRGGTVIVMESFDPQEALRLIEQYRVTHAQLVPTHFVRMLKLPKSERQRHDVSSLRYAIHAAAPCPVEVKEQMLAWWGPVIHEFYGCSEGIGFARIGPQEWLTHKGSVGKPSLGKALILDEAGVRQAPGQPGQIWFEGGGDFAYHNDPAKTAGAHDAAGRTTVGDIGYLDEEGYLYLTDRASHMIISGGVNIYPQEIENVLIQHRCVGDVAVIGVPDEEFGEQVKAVVIADGGTAGPELADELIAWCRERLAGFKCPRSVDFVDELPRLPTGKLLKRQLRQRYWPAAQP
ncbi:MAG: acyl-CoA synthetase [Pseudomonadota bacterium]